MFKKTSRSKNLRRKVETSDNDEPIKVEQAEEEAIIQKTIISSKKKKSAATKKTTISTLSFADEEGGDAEAFQLKKNLKPSRKFAPQMQVDTIMGDLDEEKPSSYYDNETLEKLRASTPSLPASVRSTIPKHNDMDDNDSLLREKFSATMNAALPGMGAIPDSGAILAAKKKRQQLRKGISITETGDDFIALDDSENGGSRLIREEDEVGDDDEADFEKYVGDKLDLNKLSAKSQEKERLDGARQMIDEAEAEGGDSRSEDMDRWEADMIKFGGVRPKQEVYDPYQPPSNYKPAVIPQPCQLSNLTDIMRTLDMNQNDIEIAIQQCEGNMTETKKSINNAEVVESDLVKDIERNSKRYNYFQELAQYVNDLGEFLDAKYPELEKLEAEMHDIIFTKTETAISRRYQLNLDDLCTFTNIQLDEEMTGEPEVDEFGRVRELRNSETARARRRAEKHQRLERHTDFVSIKSEEEVIREESYWTDDEMSEDYYKNKTSKIEHLESEKIVELMADVGSDFRSIDAVKDKFEAWKLEYYDDYQKAYGSLCLPGAFEFYMRLELVTWDPFSDPRDFDSMHWHTILSEYGISNGHESDVEMINKTVEKTMIRKMKSMLNTLDVFSSKQMRYAAQMLEQISYYVDMNEKPYKDLAFEILQLLEDQMTTLIDTIATSSIKSDLDDNSGKAKCRFFYAHCKYLKTLALWKRLLPKEQLLKLGQLLYDKILSLILQPDIDPTDNHLRNEATLLLSHLAK
ncbi:nineteen complex-related protein 2-domain-containing protein [Mycotypha africana]|uniref:nineteen complex-related protein 2-domain-containing protein n=1 Tax=Mycotypha africana TaxID=64632 RepID=UPI0023016238|nr:nineteen complex-related protein 2-domain-containing protein [Mycotypha africana]KAI8981606.1 nineteen complex-related protein 2-domain-containing protein [Mycotypha africana]